MNYYSFLFFAPTSFHFGGSFIFLNFLQRACIFFTLHTKNFKKKIFLVKNKRNQLLLYFIFLAASEKTKLALLSGKKS